MKVKSGGYDCDTVMAVLYRPCSAVRSAVKYIGVATMHCAQKYRVASAGDSVVLGATCYCAVHNPVCGVRCSALLLQ
jgi:hypothetical protein